MIAHSIENEIRSQLSELIATENITVPSIILEVPRNKEFGEISCNVALIASKQLRESPRKIAERLAASFKTSPETVEKVEIAGPGFLNFYLSRQYFNSVLKNLLEDPAHYGDVDEGMGEKVHFEYVSANPTGPVNIVSARSASVGNTLVNVFRKRGFSVHSEYYVNDGGGQIRKLGLSIKARLEQVRNDADSADIPEGGYHGEYLIDIAKSFNQQQQELPDDDETLGRFAADSIRKGQEETLKKFRVTFDKWFRESSLYEKDLVNQAYEKLISSDVTYEKDGAVFFKASEFGDSEDRVVKTSDGRYTYVIPDLAYHLVKNSTHNRAINLLGPDHHGHILQLKSALKALGLPKEFFHPIIIQQVNLKRDGAEVKMSKRAGVGIILEELIDEVGVDAARFFFLLRRTSSSLDFDIDLAKKHSEDNPVFYVQYAHARIQSILRQPAALEYDLDPDADISVLKEEAELDILRIINRYPMTLSAIVRGVEPHPLTIYLMELAKSFHLFYSKHRVIGEDKKLTAARLLLCKGVAGMLREVLNLMGVSAPDKM